MKYSLILFLLTLPFLSTAQSAKFKKIYVTNEDIDTAIRYPVIVLKNTVAANRINKAIKDRIFWYDDDKLKPATVLLRRDREDRHLNLYYEVQVNHSSILSFTMILESIGVNTNNWNEYFNFDLNTGKELTLKGIIHPEKYESFKEEVFRIKKDSLQQYLIDAKQRLDDEELSQGLYEADTSRILDKGCMNSVSLKTFLITSSHIIIYDECFFPHSMMTEHLTMNLRSIYSH